jgi:hypothetical protein
MKIVAQTLLALLCLLGPLEIGLRLLDPDLTLGYAVWSWHPDLGWSQTPGGHFEYVYEADAPPVVVDFNSLGFRDREHALEKPAGVRRVIVLGDSFSEAVQVGLEQTYWHRIEALLAEQTGAGWEVINLGVGDFGTGQESIALETIGFRFDPDVVVIQIFPLNDIINNSIELRGLSSPNDPYRPWFVEQEGRLVAARPDPIRNWLRGRSSIFRLAEYAFMSSQFEMGEAAQRARVAELERRGFHGLDPIWSTYLEPEAQIPEIARAWRVTELLLERMVVESRKRGAQVVALVIPYVGTIAETWPLFRSGYPDHDLDARYPERRITALMDRLGVPTVVLRDGFEQRDDPTDVFVADGHLNAMGHELTARWLAEAIARTPVAASR